MSVVEKARSIRSRLAKAIQRHGLLHVVRVVILTAARQGVIDTFRSAGAGRPFVHAPSKGVQSNPGAQSDLDVAYTLSEAGWRAWAPVLAGIPTGNAPSSASAPPALVVVIVGGGAADAEAVVKALGPGATAWSSGAAIPPGAFVLFLKAGDAPAADLSKAIGEAAQGGVCEVVSFDLVRRTGDRIQPMLLPGANPTLLRSADYLFSRIALRGAALGEARDLAAADPRALLLAWLDSQPRGQERERWRHVGRPLLLAAISDSDIGAQREVALAERRKPVPRLLAGGATAVICTKDKGHLTRQLVRQLLAKDRSVVEEVVIVSNDTTNPYALQTLRDLSAEPRVRVIRDDGPFNFSRLSNAGVRAGVGRGQILLLNDDIAPVSEDWIERLASRLDDPAVGAVGPLLLYPDERVQHAGMYLGFRGIAGHALRGARLPAEDYLLTASAPREVSAVTGAVLMTSRTAFEAVKGLDEELATYLQDVDYCLRLREAGLINVFDPAAVLIHMESASIRALDHPVLQAQRHAERERFVARWGAFLTADPLHPRGFDLEDETLRRLAGPAGRRPRSRR